MLRLPPFHYHRPRELREAVDLLARFAGEVMPVAGGTDLIPNMKHGLFTPAHLVALGQLGELQGVEVRDGELLLGAGESLSRIATHPLVREHLPALAEAAAHVAGPQLRNRGTLGGNLCLDTRCTYYNQTEFWRGALGYCLKKDGTVCHVTRVGKRCVAAHSADTPPVLMTVDAQVELEGADGGRTLPIREFFVADGIWNSRREPGEIVTRIRIPLHFPGEDGAVAAGGLPQEGGPDAPPTDMKEGADEARLERRTAYRKLRQRRAVDFPLLTVAVAAWFRPDGRMEKIRGVVTGLGSRPRELSGWEDIGKGERLSPGVVEALAERAHRQCTPLENHIVDPEWRKAMVAVEVRRALETLGGGAVAQPLLRRAVS
jgi:4-hydroxybenzoyl-CoA reductase subunit beta